MGLNLVQTYAVNNIPTSAGNMYKYQGQAGHTWAGTGGVGQIGSLEIDGQGNASTDSNGTGYGVSGNAYSSIKSSGLLVDRYGQKDGRVVVKCGHHYSGSGGSRYLGTGVKGNHMLYVTGVNLIYNSDAASEQKYAANLQRIMLLYAYNLYDNNNKAVAYVYEATVKNSGSSSLRTNYGAGDRLFSYSISSSDRALVMGNKMTCEGVYMEFSANQSPGCCKNKHVAARVWGMTPILHRNKNDSISTSAPSLMYMPYHSDLDLKRAKTLSGLVKLQD